ncbi:hypothetical protein ACFQ5J_01010 [Lacticaseibacillus baoqingensis]|uniref:DUF4352 domain-containing protein n=1 Tax=Lacticaseibacillus baoqingensis TaxID=2486013 RepID=A0ABW4E1J2_9LACO|nr:hypothetical protein [Lacticaseibacillus baoqingensis]
MFKQGLIVGVLALGLIGCGAKPTSQKQSQSQSQSQVASIYYHQLSVAQQHQVSFTFKAIADETQAHGHYLVDMTVANDTNKRVEFDQSKFLLSPAVGAAPIKSTKTGTLTIAPKQRKTVTGLFAATAANFTGAGEFCYLNRDYLLAYSFQADKAGGATSKNRTDQTLIAKNQAAKASTPAASAPAASASSQSSAASVSSSQPAPAASSQPAQDSSSTPAHVINSADQAIAIAAPLLNTAASALRARPVADGWQVGPKMTFADVIVHYDGSVVTVGGAATGPSRQLN